MKTKFINMEKELLLKERTQVQEDLAHLREVIRSQVDTDPDEGDADISEREKDVVLIEILERTLRSINKALQAIDTGHYGICEQCNNPIPPERLEARPDATLCIMCQQEAEKSARRGHNKYQPLESNRWKDNWAYEIQINGA